MKYGFSIGEVSKIINVPSHSIRYWCDSLKHIKVIIGIGERRYFDKESIEELKKVKMLLEKYHMSLEGIKDIVKYGKIKIQDDKSKFDKKLLENIAFKIDKILKLIENYEI